MILKLFFLIPLVKGQSSGVTIDLKVFAYEALMFPEEAAANCSDASKKTKGGIVRALDGLWEGDTVELNKCYKFGDAYSVKYTCDPAAYSKAKEASDFQLSSGTEVPYMVMSFYAEADCAGKAYNA